jgi:hypothetical protein
VKRREREEGGTGGERTAEGKGNKGLKMENQYEVGYSLITKEEHMRVRKMHMRRHAV